VIDKSIAHAKRNEVGFFWQERWTVFDKYVTFYKTRRSMGLDTQLLLKAHSDPKIYERQPAHLPGLSYLARSLLGYIDDSIFYNAGNDAVITRHLII
jgi:hypothetical protein